MRIERVEIARLRPATPKQKGVGMLAKFDVNLIDDQGQVFLSLRNFTLRTSRKGHKYVEPPFETYVDNRGETKKSYFFYLYPNAKDRDAKLSGIVAKVEEAMASTATKSDNLPF